MGFSVDNRLRIAAPWLLFLFALGVRFLHIGALRPLPLFENPYEGLDADLYVALARGIAGGELYPPELLHAAPLYAYWLGFFFFLFGDGAFLAVRLAQALLGAAAAPLIARAARPIAGLKGSVAAGIAAAVLPPFILYEGTLQSAALVPFLVSAVLVASGARRSSRGTVGAGLLLGVLALDRPDTLPLVLLIPIGMIIAGFGKRRALLHLVGTVALVLPFTIASSVRSGGPVPISGHGGIHFYIGNHAGAGGYLSPVKGIEPNPAGFARDARLRAETDVGRSLTPFEINRYWSGKAWSEVGDDFPRALKRLGIKFFLFSNDYEAPNNEDLYYWKGISPVLNLPIPLFGILFPFGLFGLLFLPRVRKEGGLCGVILLTAAASAIIFFVTARYRLIAVPALIPLAAAGAIGFPSVMRRGPFPGLALAGLLLFSNWPLPRFDFAAPESRMGFSYLHAGKFEEAGDTFRRALTIRPDFEEARIGLARVLAGSGDQAGAEEIYRDLLANGSGRRDEVGAQLSRLLARSNRLDEAITLGVDMVRESPDDPMALNNLAASLIRSGEDDRARPLLERAVTLEPDQEEARFNLALILARQGRLEEAASHIGQILRDHPGSKRALFNGGSIAARLADYDQARIFWERLFSTDPDYPRLGEQLERLKLMESGSPPREK